MPETGRLVQKLLSILLLLAVSPIEVLAGEADVVDAEVDCDGFVCDFSVTVRHDDEGWDHYADRWEVLDPGGNVLGVRELAHPHVQEQPFTRSLRSIEIPTEITEVIIRSHDTVHGYGGSELTIDIPR